MSFFLAWSDLPTNRPLCPAGEIQTRDNLLTAVSALSTYFWNQLNASNQTVHAIPLEQEMIFQRATLYHLNSECLTYRQILVSVYMSATRSINLCSIERPGGFLNI